MGREASNRQRLGSRGNTKEKESRRNEKKEKKQGKGSREVKGKEEEVRAEEKVLGNLAPRGESGRGDRGKQKR